MPIILVKREPHLLKEREDFSMNENQKAGRTKTVLSRVLMAVTSVLLAAAVGLSAAAPHFSDMLDGYFTRRNIDVTEESKHAAFEKNTSLAIDVEREGAVLLQNKDGVLPLSDDVKKVNVFGWASTQWLGGGSGSGQIIAMKCGILDALERNGIEYNKDLADAYRGFQEKREFDATLSSAPEESCILYEPSIEDQGFYTEELLSGAKNFSDTAIVVFGRLAGESNDCTQVQYKRSTKGGEIVTDETRTYLDLSTEEEALLRYTAENFDKVIVVLNTGNVMAMGLVESIPGVDALLMAGLTGSDGAAALPEILWGKVSPSGKTADTWAYDFRTAASYAGAGLNGVGAYANGQGLYPFNGTESGNFSAPKPYDRVAYVDYAEGIYVGYKWYETADAEGYWDTVSNEFGEGYKGIVQYPFGYGLSYTNFKWEIEEGPADGSAIKGDEEITFKVKVTNTGSIAGKDVVELYYSAPYTSGQIEKSAVELAAFAKTKMLEPGESDTVTLTLQTWSMASYDCYDANGNGFKGYELDEGNYDLSLRTDSHTVADKRTVSLSKNVQYAADPVTGLAVNNKFTAEDAMDGVSVDGSDAEQNITFMTRADFAGTFPTEKKDGRTLGDKAVSLNLYTAEMADAFINDQDQPITTGAKNGLKIEENGKLTDLGQKLGTDYDAEEWESLLDQMTMDEMKTLTLHGYGHTAEVPSVGKPATVDSDGPAEFGSFGPLLFGLLDVQPYENTGFPNAGVIAQTWNVDLAREMGYACGVEAGNLGATGWYAPATNMHRSPFNGRNYEYYSEDSYLSGQMCGNTVAGAKNAGVYCFVKHMICNDGEAGTYRDSVYVWMTEQTLRETYLEPFRMLVEEFGATAIMSSYNRIGAVWTGGSRAMLTGVLRDEWNFKGAVITDYSDHNEYMNGDQMLRAGGDLWMDAFSGAGQLDCETESGTFQQAIRNASKNIIYMYLNARTNNLAYAESMGDASLVKPQITVSMNIWRQLLIGYDVIAVVLFVLAFLNLKKARKLRNEAK